MLIESIDFHELLLSFKELEELCYLQEVCLKYFLTVKINYPAINFSRLKFLFWPI